MDGNRFDKDQQPASCRSCREQLQDYLDGTLEKTQSLQLFLHLRDCPGCQAEHDHMQGLFQLLETLPDHEVPVDFDEAVLASVPYAAYQAMEPLRRERVPVFLEEAFLPAAVRSPITRLAGLGIAGVSFTALVSTSGPDLLLPLGIVGLVPELMVRLQGLGRRAAGVVRRAEG